MKIYPQSALTNDPRHRFDRLYWHWRWLPSLWDERAPHYRKKITYIRHNFDAALVKSYGVGSNFYQWNIIMAHWKTCTLALSQNGDKVTLNIDTIATMRHGKQGTLITFIGLPETTVLVRESPDEIIADD